MNNFKLACAALAAAVLLGLTGCATTEGGSSYFSDSALTARVKTAIFNEPGLKVIDIGVTTEDNVVQLSGSVKSRADRVKVTEVVRKVDGVKRVKNDLKVQ